jgi:hypothetical protein
VATAGNAIADAPTMPATMPANMARAGHDRVSVERTVDMWSS